MDTTLAVLLQPRPSALVRADRCDRCEAQALVRVQHQDTGLVLDFCQHHYNQHRFMLHRFNVVQQETNSRSQR